MSFAGLSALANTSIARTPEPSATVNGPLGVSQPASCGGSAPVGASSRARGPGRRAPWARRGVGRAVVVDEVLAGEHRAALGVDEDAVGGRLDRRTCRRRGSRTPGRSRGVTVGKATGRERWTSERPATRRPFQPRGRPSLRVPMRVTRASDVLWPTLIAARCHAWASDSFAEPPEASVSSPLIDDEADTTFHAPPAFVTPIVTRPPPDAATPPGVWRSVIAWVSLAARRESATCVMPASEPSRNSERLLSSQARAASPAVAPPTVAERAAGAHERRRRPELVPRDRRRASPSRRRAGPPSGRCWPERTSRSGRPGEVWMSAPIAGPAVMSVQAQARTGTNERRARMASPPKDGARIRPTRGAAAFSHSALRGSRHGVRVRAPAEELHRLSGRTSRGSSGCPPSAAPFGDRGVGRRAARLAMIPAMTTREAVLAPRPIPPRPASTPERLRRIDRHFDRYVDDGRLPGLPRGRRARRRDRPRRVGRPARPRVRRARRARHDLAHLLDDEADHDGRGDDALRGGRVRAHGPGRPLHPGVRRRPRVPPRLGHQAADRARGRADAPLAPA